jgi:hypothetical protein
VKGVVIISAEQKPICVVIDANIWLQDSNLLLRTTIGSALIYILKIINGKIGLPSVLEEEVTRNTISKGVKAAEEIKKNFKSISVIMRSHSPYKVPDEAEIKSAVQARITELDSLFHRVDFTWEHAQSALKRINEKSPPNNNNQQFKDSVIWEAILELLSSYVVHFVTKDDAFYKDRKPKINSLAKNLLSDCNKRGGIVYIYPDMASCLKVIQEDVPPLDLNSLIVEIDSYINSKLLKRDLAMDVGFEVGCLAVELSSVSPFFTENQEELALTFELCYQCYDVENTGIDERTNAVLKVKRDCLYKIDNQVISDIDMDFQRIRWDESNGELGGRGAVYLSTMKDSNQIQHTFRESIDFMKSPNFTEKERSEWVLNNKANFFEKYNEKEKEILVIFLNKYSEKGIMVFRHIVDSITKYPEFAQHGDASQILTLFGGKENLEKALNQLQNLLYSV